MAWAAVNCYCRVATRPKRDAWVELMQQFRGEVGDIEEAYEEVEDSLRLSHGISLRSPSPRTEWWQYKNNKDRVQ